MNQTTPPGGPPEKTSGQRWRRRALWAAGAVALVGVAGFLVAPPLVKSLAERQLSELLHRPVSIEGLSINPYALSAEVRGLRVLEREGGATALGFTSLYANVSLESVFRGGAVVEEVRLVEPLVSVVRLEGRRYNWSDVIDEMLAKPDDGSKSHFAVHNIRIEQGRIEFDDRPAGQKHVVADLALGVPFVSNLPSQVETFVEPLLAMKINGAPFEIRGKARPFAADRESVVDLKLDGFDLTRFLAYVPVEKTFRLPGARLSSDLQASFTQPPEGAPALTLKGGVGLDGVEIQHADGAPAIKLPSLKVAINRLAPLAREVDIASVTLDKPEVTVGRDREGRISLLSLVPRPAPQPAAPSSGKADDTGAPRPALRPRRRLRRWPSSSASSRLPAGASTSPTSSPPGPSTRPFRISTSRCASSRCRPRRPPSSMSPSPPMPARSSSIRAAWASRPSRPPVSSSSPGWHCPPTSSTSPRR